MLRRFAVIAANAEARRIDDQIVERLGGIENLFLPPG
jgi:hypothetical protein